MHSFRRLLSLLLVLLTLTWAGVVASAEPELPDAPSVAQPQPAESDADAPLAGGDADDDGVADALEMPVLPGLWLPVEGVPRALKVARFAALIPIPLAPPPAPPPRLV